MRRALTALAALGSLLAALLVTAPAADAHPYCGIRWGSLAKHLDGTDTYASHLVDVRAGQHRCFDRLVVDLDAGTTATWVRYVDRVRRPGSGTVVPLRGGARLQIVTARAYDEDGNPTYTPARPRHLVPVAGYRTFRQVAFAGSFEGETTLGLGVRARLPFRVFTLDGPGDGSRLVVDVAHRWHHR